MISIEFLIASIIVALIPGSGVIYTISIAISSNRKNMVYAVIGCTLGIVPHIITSILVLYFLISINSSFLELIKYLGVAYLFYLAYCLYISEGRFSLLSKEEKSIKILVDAIAINLLNPKLMIFLISFIPQYISSDNQIEKFLYLSTVFMIITFIVFLLYGFLATYIKYKVLDAKNKKIILQKIFSIIFFILCIQILLNT